MLEEILPDDWILVTQHWSSVHDKGYREVTTLPQPETSTSVSPDTFGIVAGSTEQSSREASLVPTEHRTSTGSASTLLSIVPLAMMDLSSENSGKDSSTPPKRRYLTTYWSQAIADQA
jgi:hypothetical protein